MPVIRDLWTKNFTKTDYPRYICPRCGDATLKLLLASIFESEDGSTSTNKSREEWEPDFWAGRFSCDFKCAKDDCAEIVAVVGRVTLSAVHGEDGLEHYSEFEPVYFYPAPNLIDVPEDCPNSVRAEIAAACALIRCDPASAANRLRCAIEAFLTNEGVRRFTLSKQRKYANVSLHHRIDLYKSKEPEFAEMLLAVKWLGNVGSHGEIALDNVFDAFDILEHVLEQRFHRTAERIRVLAGKINKRRGPVNKRTRRKR